MSYRRTILAALALVAVSAAAGSACTAPRGINATGGDATSGGQCAVSDNDAIRLALEPSCKACHDTGSNRPIFASLEAFENLLVYDPNLVVPGDPDKSKLVALLEGTAQGTYTQMPLTGKPFAKLGSAAGISMEAITDWITALPPPDPSRVGPHRDSPMTRRLRVGEYVYALQRTLGYAEVGPTDASAGKPNALWVRDPTELGPIVYWNIGATRTWSVLGGGNTFNRVKDDTELSPSALRTITEMSLEWCGDAVGRADQTIFRDAMPSDTSMAAPAKIRANIAYLHLRLLGEPATDSDVDAYYEGVFVRAEPRGTAIAWTEVCAALVRDPRFLTF
ncbi:MAG: hypothetical protein QM820_06645 [Minicystis sp.]